MLIRLNEFVNFLDNGNRRRRDLNSMNGRILNPGEIYGSVNCKSSSTFSLNA